HTLLALAPAGSGKTTALRAIADAWRTSGRQVVGLAPSAVAAAVLRDELGAAADTVHAHEFHQRDLTAGTMVIVDEVGMLPTALLDDLITRSQQAGAVVRLVGDDQQLAAVEAGGAIRLFAHDKGAVRLDQVVRFR